MNIIDALKDRSLFGGLPGFRDLTSWRPWLTFLSGLYGLPLSPEEVARFCRHTGRTRYAPPAGGWREAVAIVGRQSGKSRIAALVASFEAALATREADGTELYCLMVSQDQRASSRTVLRYAVAPFDHLPMLAQEVTGRTADSLTLQNGTALIAYPCRPAAVRGLRARVVILDELAFYRSGDGAPVDREMLRSVRPCLATTGGKLLVLSSPYGSSGALWDLHRQHHGRDDSPVLVWQASAPEMNPTLPADYLAQMQESDPEAYRSEVLGEFRSGISSLFDSETLDDVVVAGRREIPAVAGVTYRAFADPSGGRSDAFTLAIGHQVPDRVVVDVLRAWAAPFNPSGVVAEAAELLRGYRLAEVTGDRYAGEWPAEAFRANGISYQVAEHPKSDLYLTLLAVVNSGAVELPDIPALLRELRSLERRRGASGRDRVDHPSGGHDDQANAIAGLVHLLRPGAGGDPGILAHLREQYEQRQAAEDPARITNVTAATA